MSSNIAISVENISKIFHIYDKPQDRLKQMLSINQKKYYQEFCAIDNVSFNIKKGETVGIVGRNGSGKSTLLQLICGILTPTIGDINTNGRVAALLELGSGFNPEFTGRENVYLNAAILGLTQEETDTKYEEIVKFADIGIFIDQSVKTYSSGMMMRLAFAVAINVEPQILVVDEALSVGDELFQRKCFAKIQEIKESGCTILFVSHSGGTVVELCDRAILLHAGKLILSGAPKLVIGKYQRLLHSMEEQHEKLLLEIEEIDSIISDDESSLRQVKASELIVTDEYDFFDQNLQSQSIINYPSNGATIESIQIICEKGHKVNVLRRGLTYKYQYKVKFHKTAYSVRAGTMFKTTTGLEVAGLQSHGNGNGIEYVDEGSVIQFSFDFKCILLPGVYFMNAGLVGNDNGMEVFLHRIVDAISVRVVQETGLCVSALVDISSTDARDDCAMLLE